MGVISPGKVSSSGNPEFVEIANVSQGVEGIRAVLQFACRPFVQFGSQLEETHLGVSRKERLRVAIANFFEIRATHWQARGSADVRLADDSEPRSPQRSGIYDVEVPVCMSPLSYGVHRTEPESPNDDLGRSVRASPRYARSVLMREILSALRVNHPCHARITACKKPTRTNHLVNLASSRCMFMFWRVSSSLLWPFGAAAFSKTSIALSELLLFVGFLRSTQRRDCVHVWRSIALAGP
jgi:hypothetical protein